MKNQSTDKIAESQKQVLLARLIQKRTELGLRLKQIDASQHEKLSADFSEQAVELENQEVLNFLSHEAQLELRKVEKAIQRFEKNSYGSCDACHTTIGYQRLNAYPYAELCYQCAVQEQF